MFPCHRDWIHLDCSPLWTKRDTGDITGKHLLVRLRCDLYIRPIASRPSSVAARRAAIAPVIHCAPLESSRVVYNWS